MLFCDTACPGGASTKVKVVRVDGDYDYIDRATNTRRAVELEQQSVHGHAVWNLKHVRRRRRGNILKGAFACCEEPGDPIARNVFDNATAMATQVSKDKPDCMDKEWYPHEGQALRKLLKGHSSDNDEIIETMMALAVRVQSYVEEEPIITNVSAPARVFGDIHGQFRDLLLWLHDFGFPHEHGPNYIFNGDWVDRGAHQVECIALLFAMKIVYPSKVFLSRGNHEFRDQNEHGGAAGFHQCCQRTLGSRSHEVYDAIHNAFDYLPLGALLADAILVIHGGIGDGEWTLEDLKVVERPITEKNVTENNQVYNILWSDPIPETIENSFGVHDSPRDGHRKMIHQFGKDVTQRFCERNGIQMIVRSHQEKHGGCGYEVMHDNKLLRVFSARDYENHRNDGAILKVRASFGGKLVVRAQLLRSITKESNFRTATQGPEGEAVEESLASVFCSCPGMPSEADELNFDAEDGSSSEEESQPLKVRGKGSKISNNF